MELNSPLFLIKKLIYINLIKPIQPDVEEGESHISISSAVWSSYTFTEGHHSVLDPIPLKQLESILRIFIPKSISKNEKATWEKGIRVRLTLLLTMPMFVLYAAGLSRKLLFIGMIIYLGWLSSNQC